MSEAGGQLPQERRYENFLRIMFGDHAKAVVESNSEKERLTGAWMAAVGYKIYELRTRHHSINPADFRAIYRNLVSEEVEAKRLPAGYKPEEDPFLKGIEEPGEGAFRTTLTTYGAVIPLARRKLVDIDRRLEDTIDNTIRDSQASSQN